MRKRTSPISTPRIMSLLVFLLLVIIMIYMSNRKDREEVIPTPKPSGSQSTADSESEPGSSEVDFEISLASNEGTRPDVKNEYVSLKGVVLDEDTKKPVAGLNVKCNSDFRLGDEVEGEPQNLSTNTDENGAFHFDNLLYSHYMLFVDDQTRIYQMPRQVHLEFRDKEIEKTAILYAHRGGVLSGRVYMEDTGEGVENVMVRLSLAGGSSRVFGTNSISDTNANGRYQITQLPPGVYEVIPGIPGFSSDNNLKKTVSIKEGQSIQDVDFVLQRGLQLSGQVIAEDENVEGIVINAMVNNQGWNNYKCDSEGRFTFSGLTSGNSITLTANPLPNSNQLKTVAGPYFVGPSSIEGIEIKMDMGGSISGVVVDRHGNPITNAVVRFENDTNGSENAGSDSKGNFIKYGLEAKKYTVVASLSSLSDKSGMDRAAVIENVWPTQGETIEGLRLVCDIAAEDSISGRVTYESGAPASGINVTAEPNLMTSSIRMGFGFTSVTTDANGYYKINGLFDSQYTVWFGEYIEVLGMVLGPGKTVQAGDSNVDMVLPDPEEETDLTIKGQVLYADSGKPVPSFEILVKYTNSNGTETGGFFNYYDKEGRFTQRVSTTGSEVSVSASSKGYTSAPQLISGPWSGDVTEEINFQLELVPVPAKLTGRVTNDEGEAIVGAQIWVADATGAVPLENWTTGNSRTDLEGCFTFETQKPQSVQFWISHPEYAPVSIEGQTSTVSSPRINLTLPKFGQLEGYVLHEGKPIPGSHVSLTMDLPERLYDWSPFHTTDANGWYSIKSLAPVNIKVRAIAFINEEKLVEETQSVTIQAGKITNLDFDLK